MKQRRWLLGVVSSLLALGMISCAGEPDIDRTQANRLPKSMFDGTWYVRTTVIDVPSNQSHSFVGWAGSMEKIRWEIQEDHLLAYRAYEEIPGTATAGQQPDEENEQFKEEPIAIFDIAAHFDIQRQYNAATGEQTNVIVENTTDREWWERDYIRVEWHSQTLLDDFFDGQKATSFFEQAFRPTDDALRTINVTGERVNFEQLDTIRNTPADQWAGKIGYFDFVSRMQLEPATLSWQGTEYPLCFFIIGGVSQANHSCGPAEVKTRTSFLRVTERNYEPVQFDDRRMSKFGYFRTERFTYDRKYGFKETGRIYLANMHNIWENPYKTNADGTIQRDPDGRYIPNSVQDRTPKPIVYHLNKDYPCEMVGAAQQVAKSWNQAFRRTVAVAKGLLPKNGEGKQITTGDPAVDLAGVSTDQVPDMFKLDLNGWVQTNPGDDWSCNNLTRDESKVVALHGDLRYNLLAWVNQPQRSGPLGFGPSYTDPETGEIISGTAWVYGAAVDTYAGQALDIVRLLAGDPTLDLEDDFLTGDYITSFIQKNKPVIDPAKIPADVKHLKGKELRNLFFDAKKLDKLNTIKQQGLEPAVYGLNYGRQQLIRGTDMEKYMIDDEIVRGLAPHVLTPADQYKKVSELPEHLRSQLNLMNWVGEDAQTLNNYRINRAQRKNIFLAEFADDSIQGFAEALWQKYGNNGNSPDYDGMWQEARERIFQGVMEHEVGHTIGLRHNFAGSYDSVNYFNKYWNLRTQGDADGRGALVERNPLQTTLDLQQMLLQASQSEAQIKGGLHEYQYSSIMDYHNKFNADIQGIGKYDHAAVLYAYGNKVEVFDTPSADAKLVLRQRFSDCQARFENVPNIAFPRFLEQWHYSSAWNLLGKTEGVVTRRFAPADQMAAGQVQAEDQCKAFIAGNQGTVAQFVGQVDTQRELEVPYMFCSDEYVGSTQSCNRWDLGADPWEIVDNVITTYDSYYFFNNFKRQRFGFSASSVYSRVSGRYFYYLPNTYQHWLFSVGFSGIDDTTQENLWTFATFRGFNKLMQVVSMPQTGTFCRSNEDALGNLSCSPSGNQITRVSSSLEPTTDPSEFVIQPGEGRRRFSRFDFDFGYYYQSQILEAGHFWDYLAAIQALTASTGIFVGVESATDFTTYLVPMQILFEDELKNYFEAIYTENYGNYAPYFDLDNKSIYTMPAATLSAGGPQLDPATGAPVAVPTNNLRFNMQNWFTLKFYTLLQGMANFTSLYSLDLVDRYKVFRLGSGEQLTAGAGSQVVTCNTENGIQYSTVELDSNLTTDPNPAIGVVADPNADPTAASVLVSRCKRYKEQWVTGGSTSALRALNQVQEDMDLMAGLYDIFGRTI